MLSKLPPRERQIVDILYERGALAVADICDALPDPAERIGGPRDAQAARGQGLCPAQRIRSAASSTAR